MIDFLIISTRPTKRGTVEIYPRFRLYPKSSDLMIRGGDFYAIWIEELGLWSTKEQDALQLIDRELDKYAEDNKAKFEGSTIKILHMWDSESGMVDSWHKYCQKQMRDSFHMLDESLIFSNTETTKKDYATKRLPYPLEQGSITAFDKLMSTLYSPEEREKIEWAIGAVISGDSKTIQKFMVLYGAAGTGKSTVLNIIQQLFEGYYSVFDAKALGSSSNQFALEAFKTNPLVAIQHDGDLSRIEDNTRLNSLVSHEIMTVNEKFKGSYANRFKCFLFMGTNKPVKITDGKSGIIRRLIDVTPSGNKLSSREYKTVMKQVGFELGAIANHCLGVYKDDPGKYDDYIPITMIGASNDFYNFVIDSYHVFVREDGTTLKAAWEMYKNYCDEAKVPFPLSQRNFKEELKNYFRDYVERMNLDDGSRIRSYYSGFKTNMFETEKNPGVEKPKNNLIKFETIESIFDKERADCFAQYANDQETPSKKWEKVKTKLKDLDTSKIHYVKVPENHIVIDFDIKDRNGKKSLDRNIEEASKWPATYAELSKSGNGVHLHYIYNGDASKLSRVYDENIEVKVFTGNSSLRRRLTKCNNLPIATISSGLPLKGDNKVINFEGVKNEKALRTMIKRNLNKEYHAATKPSVDFIYKILEDAYNSGISYDVSDMRNAVLAFAASSTHQADYCIKLVNKMSFKSNEQSEGVDNDEQPIIFYDVEVFPNLFIVCWKIRGEGKPVVPMINPTPTEIEDLLRFRLIGFNNKRYDDHILYARLMGYTNKQLYNLSQRIINGERDAMFGEAYSIAYTDIYDFSAKKQSLKKWEIELNIHHQELGLPWDEPVPEERWEEVAGYCTNDVIATEAVFDHLQGDWKARQILAELAGMPVNASTNSLTTRIIFGKERNPKLVYTNLATGEQEYDGVLTDTPDVINAFPGYEFVKFGDDKKPHNMYRGEDVGMGGYVYAEPGMYGRTICFDVSGMHPASIRAMNCFGEYTKNFGDIVDARLAIKHKDFDTARKMLDGKLAPYLDDESQAKALAGALKIAVNSVYGLTAANFDNPFRDVRNKNNIVALRGALFMVNLKDEIQSRGFRVVHCKTDSVKVENPSDELCEFIVEYGRKYGYQFEIEHVFDRICLVNDAVYIAKLAEDDPDDPGKWTATGTQFQVPYVFKTLFSKEEIVFDDLCETKSVTTALYLRNNDPDAEEVIIDPLTGKETTIKVGDKPEFIGRVGRFCPIKPGHGGKELIRESKDKDGNVKYASATGAKGYLWLEAEAVYAFKEKRDAIDYSYYNKLVDDAVETISQFGDFELFVSDDPIPYNYMRLKELDTPPWE